jgi:predicted HTH transcriptional regulator
MAVANQFVDLIRLGREERFLEYKCSVAFGDIKSKIVRTAMAMANCRDGGTIVIGVALENGQFAPTGVAAAHLASYDSDDVQAAINRHADPYVRTELHRVELDGKTFLAIVVHEFDEIPVVCKKDGLDLRQGAIYTRAYRMPESCEVRSQTEMREIIELATEKAVRVFIRRVQSVGLPLPRPTTDAARFDKQLGEL